MSSTDNPYRAPSSPVADVRPPAGDPDFGTPGATVDAGRGAAWISEAWTLYKAAPVMWVVALLIMVGLQMVLSMVPIIGSIASALLGPVFMVGVLAFAHGIARGGEPDLGQLFAGFKEKTGSLVAVAALYLLLFVGLVVVLAIGAFFMLGGAALVAATDPDQIMSQLLGGAGLLGLLLFLLVFMAAGVLIVAAYWFAPGLVFYAGMGVGDAMKESFRACMRNWLPFLVFGLLGMLVILGGLLAFVIGLFLVSLPVLSAAYYTCFRDIFGQRG